MNHEQIMTKILNANSIGLVEEVIDWMQQVQFKGEIQVMTGKNLKGEPTYTTLDPRSYYFGVLLHHMRFINLFKALRDMQQDNRNFLSHSINVELDKCFKQIPA